VRGPRDCRGTADRALGGGGQIASPLVLGPDLSCPGVWGGLGGVGAAVVRCSGSGAIPPKNPPNASSERDLAQLRPNSQTGSQLNARQHQLPH
jgi:hypothetical protein